MLQKIKTMSDTVICPKCQSEFTYEQDNLQVCSQCFHEWDPNEVNSGDTILDMNGNELQNGDSVIVMKDLPVKGAPKPVKAGTKVKISVCVPIQIIISTAKSMVSEQWL